MGAFFWSAAFYLMRANGDGPEPIAGFAFLMLVATSVFSAMWLGSFENRGTGFCFQLGFTRPISTRLLVAAPMVYVAGTAALCYLIPATLLRLLFEIPFPLLSTSALIATASACFIAAAWSSRSIYIRTLSLAAVGAAFGGITLWSLWQRGTDAPLLITGQDWQTIFAFSIWHYFVLLLVFGCAVVAATWAVDRQRHGEQLRFQGASRFVRGFVNRFPRRTRPFDTPVGAQFWLEMRRSGVKVFLAGLAASALAFLYISCVNLYSEPLRGKAAVMWLIALAICPFVYQILGAEWSLGLKRRQGAVWLSAFDAAQAIGSDTLIVVKLIVLVTSVLASWLAMACAAAIQTVVWGSFRDWAHISEAISSIGANVTGPWWAVVAILAVVLCASSSAMMIALGLWLPRYPKVFAVAAFVVFVHILLAVWDSQHAGVFIPLWIAYGWLLSAAMVTVCLWALCTSLSWGCVSKRFLVVALCLWALFVCATVALYLKIVPDGVTIPLSALALGSGAMTIPLSSAAFAPLALASHRHR